MDLTELQQQYFDHLTSRGCRRGTLLTYRSALRRAWELTTQLGLSLVPDSLDRAWARALIDQWNHVEGLRPATIHRNVGALRGLVGYALRRDLIKSDPFEHLELPRKVQVERIQLSEAQLNALISATELVARPQHTVMLRALLLTQMAVGTRVSELVNLTPADLNFGQRVIRIREGKGGKTREVPLGSRASLALEEWLAARSAWLSTREGDVRVRGVEPQALWLADRGRRLSVAGVSRFLDVLARYAGLRATVRIHDLRALTAQRWKRDGVPMEVIQNWLGHSNLATTRIYVRDACANTREWAPACDLPPERPSVEPSTLRPYGRQQQAIWPCEHQASAPEAQPVPQWERNPPDPYHLAEMLSELRKLEERYPLLAALRVAGLLVSLPGVNSSVEAPSTLCEGTSSPRVFDR